MLVVHHPKVSDMDSVERPVDVTPDELPSLLSCIEEPGAPDELPSLLSCIEEPGAPDELPNLLICIEEPDAPDELRVEPTRRRAYQLETQRARCEFVIPTAESEPDANDCALFVKLPIAAKGNVAERVLGLFSGALSAVGIGASQEALPRSRVRFHDTDAFIPTDQRTAHRILVEGGPSVVSRLQAASISMNSVVACGVHIEEWYDAGLTLEDVATLDGSWHHLVQMGLVPDHAFGTQHGERVLKRLCRPPFSLNWGTATRSWGLTLDEMIRRLGASVEQIALLGANFKTLVQKHGFQKEHVALLNEPASRYKFCLDASPSDLEPFFGTADRPKAQRGRINIGI
jgi:hypothetical protein